MYLERYSFIAISNGSTIRYEFVSNGPEGSVKKIIAFDKIGTDMYNIAFGDSSPGEEVFTDNSITDNKDYEKVLATVAMTIMSFTEDHPEAVIYAEGSTPARTRLYKICITKHWKGITNHFQISGLIDSDWEKFKKDRSYSGFFGKRISFSKFDE
jgi:hypothetical protein